MLLLGILFTYIVLLGVFLFALLSSLSSVQYFIKPEVQLFSTVVILTLVGSVLLLIISIYLIQKVSGYFTKKLLEYKLNRSLLLYIFALVETVIFLLVFFYISNYDNNKT